MAVVVLVHGWLLSDRAPSRDGVAVSVVRAVHVRQLPVAVVDPAPLPAPQPLGARAAKRPSAAQVPAAAGRAYSESAITPTQAAESSIAEAGEDPTGAAAATSNPAPAVSHPTRVPSSAQWTYSLRRGAAIGEARLSWQVDGARYALSLQALMPAGREMEQHSQGGFDGAGLAPLRLADRRHGRDVRAANFQRERGAVTFSGPRWELPLFEGTQDRLSWLVQLVALAGGAPDGLRDGSELAMWVVGARGAASHWRFEVRGRVRVASPSREADALWLVREPVHPYDMRVEVWLDPAREFWPLRLRQTQIPGGEPLEWILREEPRPSPGT